MRSIQRLEVKQDVTALKLGGNAFIYATEGASVLSVSVEGGQIVAHVLLDPSRGGIKIPLILAQTGVNFDVRLKFGECIGAFEVTQEENDLLPRRSILHVFLVSGICSEQDPAPSFE